MVETMQNRLKGAGNVCEPLGTNTRHVVTLREDVAENGTVHAKEKCKTISLVRQLGH